MRNPFFEVICIRGNLTKEMKNSFEFARELLRYTRGELSKEKERGIEGVLSEMKGMRELSEELKDRAQIEKEIRLIEKFDTEKALSKIKEKRKGKKLSFVPWVAAASVILIVGISVFLLQKQKQEVVNLPVAARVEPGKATVTLEMASGLKYRLDTLSAVIRNNRENVNFNNLNGVLKIQEQDVDTGKQVAEQDYNTITVPYGGT